MVFLYSIVVCAISSLFGAPLLCPKEPVPIDSCEEGVRSARFVLGAMDDKSKFQTVLYCTDNAQVDFDTFSNTPEGLSIATPLTLLSAASGECTLTDDLTVSCGDSSTIREIDVTVCCRESDSGLNAIVVSTRESGSTAAPTLTVSASDDTEEIYFLELVNLDLTTSAPSGCNVGSFNYGCTLSDTVAQNQAYIRF